MQSVLFPILTLFTVAEQKALVERLVQHMTNPFTMSIFILKEDIYKFIDPKRAIHAKNSLGGTSPKKVKAAIIAAKKTVSS